MKNKIFIVLLLFLFVFQPPFLPIATIYWLGTIIVLLLIFSGKEKNEIRLIFHKSKMSSLWKFLLLLSVYVLIVNIIDEFIAGYKDVYLARLKSFNQLIILSGLQFCFVLYCILKLKRGKYEFEDAVRFLTYAACFQGILAAFAYYFPNIRTLFMTYGNQALNNNWFYLERRGYGFSHNLVDTFGFGMGLISGYIILFRWKDNNNLLMFIPLSFSLYAIFLNARTGILVFIIAIIIRFLYNNNLIKFLFRLVIFIIISNIVLIFLQKLVQLGLESSSENVAWVSIGLSQILDQITGTNNNSVDDMIFLSDFVDLPSNGFEFLFGTGHWIYDTGKELGFRTDIGWYNLVWEFGIVGTFIVMLGLTIYMFKPYFMTSDISIKRIALFNTISYYVVLIKAILLGSNPGTFVIYYITFCMYYYMKRNGNVKKSHLRKTIILFQ